MLLLLACAPSLYSDANPDLTPSDWSAPENTWSVAEVPASMEGEGCKRGDVLRALPCAQRMLCVGVERWLHRVSEAV